MHVSRPVYGKPFHHAHSKTQVVAIIGPGSYCGENGLLKVRQVLRLRTDVRPPFVHATSFFTSFPFRGHGTNTRIHY
jgi:hypothetical protein